MTFLGILLALIIGYLWGRADGKTVTHIHMTAPESEYHGFRWFKYRPKNITKYFKN